MKALTPDLLAMAAHGPYYWDIAPGSSKIKFDRMRRVLRAKFTQHEDLLELLLATDDASLVESATVDNTVNRLWGELDGRGRNMLGIMLALTAQKYQCGHRILQLVIGKISQKNRNMFEIIWWVSYHCSDEPDIIETQNPQSWASFNMLGESDFSDEKLQDTIGVLPPRYKSRSKLSLKIGRREIDDNTQFQ